jgi:hypothetical protein
MSVPTPEDEDLLEERLVKFTTSHPMRLHIPPPANLILPGRRPDPTYMQDSVPGERQFLRLKRIADTPQLAITDGAVTGNLDEKKFKYRLVGDWEDEKKKP